ncbi:class I SAM-dependent methyltransferase [Actinoplanes sichuanensis]|uniref:Methyltransferase domain-containing protein n=1 Tax=Actinoplanes sichuanensis TaxID=512349 RepID=A0ABW4AQ88_9ACTN|nr:class I SAM-dependent methyltransferase [Actinoplanes sichuanensis]BEL04906.1 class I SAM-dependent methyltransferase [Actinoplanes sichuanensis]
MPDRKFAHPRLAAVYDTFDSDRGDLQAYEDITAELGAHHILDYGCGTGCLAVRLAATSHRVTGYDPATASLDVARAKTDTVTWVGDLDGLSGFDLVTMTGNVAQVFLTDTDWNTTLQTIFGLLRPGGHLVFETRRPEYRVWDEWAHRRSETRDVPGIGEVRHDFQLTDVRLPYVSFRDTYTFADGDVLTSDSTLRFRDRHELDAGLTAAGFRITDVRQAPDRPAMQRVFLCEKPS